MVIPPSPSKRRIIPDLQELSSAFSSVSFGSEEEYDLIADEDWFSLNGSFLERHTVEITYDASADIALEFYAPGSGDILDTSASGTGEPFSNSFIDTEEYGTCASTLLTITTTGDVSFAEHGFGSHGKPEGDVSYQFEAGN